MILIMNTIQKNWKLLSLALMLLCTAACNNESTNIKGEGIIKNSWITTSLDFPTSYKYFSSDSKNLVLAKGEFESFQLALEVDSVSELTVKREEGSSLLNLECFKLVVADNIEGALVPVNGKVKAESDILKLWITYEADREIAAGIYTEKLSFSTSRMTQTIDVTVEVKDITLPVTPSIPITFGIYQKAISNSEDPEVQIAKRKEYFELLFDHKISPYLVTWGAPNFHLYTQSSPYDWDDPRTADYIQDPRFSALALPYWDKTDEELTELYGAVESAGLLDKSYVYFYDEPRSLEDHDKVLEGVQRINAASPSLQVNLPFFCGLTSSSDNIFAVFERYKDYPMLFNTSNWALQNNEVRSEKCANSIVDGQEWWTYVCCGQTPGFTHTTAPVGTRSMLWRSWKEGSTGFLYWAVNDYLGVDPLVMNHNLKHGDGSLVYPGSEYGSDKPVASIRLERFRDGAEDYELLLMHEQRFGREATEALLNRVYQAPQLQTADVQEVENFRLELLNSLAE